MATRVETSTGTVAGSKPAAVSLPLIAGWIVPGLGHVLVKRPIRGALIFTSITLMFLLGILMQGKLYIANTSDLLEMLGFVGDLGSGILYLVGRLGDFGHGAVQIATADYGSKFIVVAGLLNFIAAIDAHNIRIGRKS